MRIQNVSISEAVFQAARDRICEHLRRSYRNGQRVISLSELAEETSLDPQTAEQVMDRVEGYDGFAVHRRRGSEIGWRIKREQY